VDHLVSNKDLVLDLVVKEALLDKVLLDMVLQEIKRSSIGCSNSNRMIQEELHNKEAHIPIKEALHQDIQMLNKEAHHKEDHQEDKDLLLKVHHQVKPETCLARND